MFLSIKENTSIEIVEKKSKFIVNVFYVENKEETEKYREQINKKYHDARHHCFAYRIFSKEGIIEKSSDDGEPSGTAGAPMLTILAKNELVNVLVIVTRYFGGILLGTGGLVKAYSKACTLGIQKAQIIQKEVAKMYTVELEYTDLNQFQYLAQKNQITILKQEYLTNVLLDIAVKNEDLFQKMISKDIQLKNITYRQEIYL